MADGERKQGTINKVLEFTTKVMDTPNLLLANATSFLPQPCMPAARLLVDPVFQFGHSHPHPPTFGFPIPSMGPILASGCVSVLINGIPAARNGDYGASVWCGGYFPIFEIKFGSSSVFIGGARAARQLIDFSLHCLPDFFSKGGGAMKGMSKAIAKEAGKQALNAAKKQLVQGAIMAGGMKLLGAAGAAEEAIINAEEGESDGQVAADAANAAAEALGTTLDNVMMAAQLAADAVAAAMGALMGKDPGVGFPMGFIMKGSHNVMIGGFPLPGWGTILKGLGKLLKPLLRKVQAFLYKKGFNRLADAMCPATGHPVEISTGRMFTNELDFEVDGRIPIVFNRKYDTSACETQTSLGFGWTHSYNLRLWEDSRLRTINYRNEENRIVCFNLLSIGEKHFHPLEKLTLERIAEDVYIIKTKTGNLEHIFNLGTNFSGKSESDPFLLSRIVDRNSNAIDFIYDSNNNLTEIKADDGRRVLLTYSGTRIIEIHEQLANNQAIRLMSYAYNDQNDLISATNRTNVPFLYHYTNHLMIRETNRNGLSFHFEYQGEGNAAQCVHTWGDGGIYERWLAYFPHARMTKVLDGLGGTTIYNFNEFDQPTKMFNAEGGVKEFTYGPNGELLEEKDEIGRTREYKYDDFYNCIELIKEDGTNKKVEFNQDFLPIKVIDESKGEWSFAYDKNGNLTSTSNPLKATQTYIYNNKGDVVELKDALGRSTKIDWNIRGLAEKVFHQSGSLTTYKYNSRFYVEQIIDSATKLSVKYDYDDPGNVSRIAELDSKDKVSIVQRYEYDPSGNLTKFIDSRGNLTSYEYGGFNRLYSRKDALGFTRKFKYDQDERVTQIINERAETYLFEYDLIDRVKKETGFDGAERSFEYDAVGQLTKETNALGNSIFYEYDGLGRVTQRLHSKDASKNEYTYDECGRLVSAKNADSEINLKYDSAWRLVSEVQNGRTIEYEYDAENQRTARRLHKEPDKSSIIKYEYDADGNIKRLDVFGQIIEYKRDSAGRLTDKILPGGIQETYNYSPDGRLSRQRIATGGGTREIVSRNYSWDELGNLASVQDSLRGTRKYTYDAVERLQKVERLTRATEIYKPELKQGELPIEKRLWTAEAGRGDLQTNIEIEEFQYDGAGNLTQRNSNQRGNQYFSYGQGNKLTAKDKVKYYYDAVGNLVEKWKGTDVWLYEYDGDNRLVKVTDPSKQVINYGYDGLGRRVFKRAGNKETNFLWDGDVLLLDGSTEYVHEGFIPVARLSDNKLEAYHCDYQGTPKEVSNARGEIVWQGDYDEYGKCVAKAGPADQNIRFLGQYEDEETGLHYNRFRYFDADTGRYVNQDPSGLDGGFNVYAYCANPVNWNDPLGLNPCPTTKRLNELMEEAKKEAQLSDKQKASIQRSLDRAKAAKSQKMKDYHNARAAAKEKLYMGTQIDTIFKRKVDADPSLAHVRTTARGEFGPDVRDPATRQWWDLTTQKDWDRETHQNKYQKKFGKKNGTGLIWD